MSPKKPKIIVVGGSIAGAVATLVSVDHGADVTLIIPAPVRRSPFENMLDGINAALNTKGDGDSIQRHLEDTIECGDFLANGEVVKKMCEKAPAIVHLFDRMGAMFVRNREGLVRQGCLCGASRERAVSAGSDVGHQILCVLDAGLRRLTLESRLHLIEGSEFLSLVLDDQGVCRGIVVLGQRNMEVKAMPADAVIMCAGGYAGLFGAKSTSPSSDGASLSVCYQQGAHFANPEFVQFHPYTISLADKCRPISETVFCAGARVSVPREGKPWYFLEEWHPERGACVNYDKAVRAINKVSREMNFGVDEELAVHLDLKDMDFELLDSKVVELFKFYEKLSGLDCRESFIKVVPAAHQSLGGLWVNDHHASNIKGLFAAGESACLYHGANALSGNEIIASVYGAICAGEASAEYTQGNVSNDAKASLIELSKRREEDENAHIAAREGGENQYVIRKELNETLSSAAFVERNNKELGKALGKIMELKERFMRTAVTDKAEWENSEIMTIRKIEANLKLAELIVLAAKARDESRGMHFKPEFANRDDKKWQATTKAYWSKDGHKFDYSE